MKDILNIALGLLIVGVWPGSGILILWLHTPYWMRHDDPVGFGLMHFMAALCGPILVLLVLLDPNDKKQDAEWNRQVRNAKKWNRRE